MDRPLASSYDAILFDLDGVVYRGEAVIPGAAEAISRVRGLVPRVLFITNNSSATPAAVASRLVSMGILASADEVLTSAVATARLLRAEGYVGRTAFVIGESGVRDALARAGIEVLDGDPENADVVIVGWDRSFDYAKLRTASLLVQRGARLVATNADVSYPAPTGLWPGAGSILAAVTTATRAQPTIVGKPARPLLEAALEATGATAPLLVGDRIETDIVAASAMGWDSALVFSGAALPRDLLSAPVLPTYAGRDVSIVLESIPPGRFRAAEDADVDHIRALLAQASLPDDEVDRRISSTVVCFEGSTLLATACVERLAGHGLLRSVAVDASVRGKGFGLLAAASAIKHARRRGLDDVFLFTETASGFFRRLGFREVDRNQLPAPIGMSAQASKECPASAVSMALTRSAPLPAA